MDFKSYLIISITLELNFQHLNRNMYLVLNFNKIGCKYFLFIFQKAFLSLKSLCIWVRWYYFICFCDYRHCCTSCVGVHGLFWGLFRYFKTRYFCQKLGKFKLLIHGDEECLFVCSERWSLLENDLSHCRHLKGLCPVCFLICLNWIIVCILL